MNKQELDKLKEYWVDGNYLYDQEADALIEAAQDTVELIAAVEELQINLDLAECDIDRKAEKLIKAQTENERLQAKLDWTVRLVENPNFRCTHTQNQMISFLEIIRDHVKGDKE